MKPESNGHRNVSASTLVRFGYSRTLPRSLRRPVDAVLI